MLNDQQRLILIQESIDSIEKYSASGKQLFELDEDVRKSILENLREIARATNTFTGKIREAHPDVDWSKMTSMGSFLSHTDHNVDPEIIWLSVEQDVPVIKEEIRSIVHSVETVV